MSTGQPHVLRLGVLSDTHGRLDAAVIDAFGGVDHIIHAGDIDTPAVLVELEMLAPVTAVLGNCDRPGPGMPTRSVESVLLGGVRFTVAHRDSGIPRSVVVGVIVTGHTHRPAVVRAGGLVHLNPGSASQPRGPEGATVALVEVANEQLDVRIVPLEAR